jgi:hypothetical protein
MIGSAGLSRTHRDLLNMTSAAMASTSPLALANDVENAMKATMSLGLEAVLTDI